MSNLDQVKIKENKVQSLYFLDFEKVHNYLINVQNIFPEIHSKIDKFSSKGEKYKVSLKAKLVQKNVFFL